MLLGNVGKEIYLFRDTEIQGYLARSKLNFLWSIYVTIANDSSLLSFYMVNETEIYGIPCSNGLIGLYPDGHLSFCTLSKDFKIDGKLYEEGTRMKFDENGKAHEFSQI